MYPRVIADFTIHTELLFVLPRILAISHTAFPDIVLAVEFSARIYGSILALCFC